MKVLLHSEKKHIFHFTTIYSRLSLSRPRLSRIIAYTGENLVLVLTWKFKNRQQNIVEKKGEIALRSNFSFFPQYFQYMYNFSSLIT